MAEFNLIDEPWIPCIDVGGSPRDHSIRDALFKAHRLREICDDSPLVTVAIHRLLLAILYRAYDGPRSYAAWKGLHSRNSFDVERVGTYLDGWRDGFDLFGDKRPFYQMAGFETDKPISVSRLAMQRASGNNATLFDHSMDDIKVSWVPAQAARNLVAYQAFASGGGKSSAANIRSSREPRPNFADAPALRGMNIWLQGSNVFETLMINLAPLEDQSCPPWELDEPHQYRDNPGGKKRPVVMAIGVVDRLTWQSRLVRLISDGGTVSQMHCTQGRSADKSAGDPMKVYRMSKEEGVSALPLSSSRAAWRDAHSILMIPPAGSNERRPDCLNLLARARVTGVIDDSQTFVTHIVGLASAPNKAAKFLLWRYERMPVPTMLLGDQSLIERLGSLVRNSEQAGKELGNRIWRLARLYLAPDSDSPQGGQPDSGDVNRLIDAVDPRAAYWAILEGHFLSLIVHLPDDWDGEDEKPNDQQLATSTWRGHVKREARRALEESTRSLGTTARAIQAVARVRTAFTDDDLNPPPQKTGGIKTKGGKRK